MSAIMFWIRFPLRAMGHFLRLLFGHPILSTIVLGLAGVLFAYLSTLQVTEPIQVAGTHQRIVMMFPSAGLIAAICAMTCGTLLMWMAEHFDKPITSWTKAPSLWSRKAAEPVA